MRIGFSKLGHIQNRVSQIMKAQCVKSLIVFLGMLVAWPAFSAKPIKHDAEYYLLLPQHKDNWSNQYSTERAFYDTQKVYETERTPGHHIAFPDLLKLWDGAGRCHGSKCREN